MRSLALARFRLLTIVRKGTPIVVMAVLPPLAAAVPLSVPEPLFRNAASAVLGIHAQIAIGAWLLHALFLGLSILGTGKVTMPIDPLKHEIPDLMDTAPVPLPSRFWGEALGALGAGAVVHVCCLPLLAAVAALSPMPLSAFLAIDAGAVAVFVLAAAGAAWQRRAPRTKYAASRGPRNVLVVALLLLLIVRYSAAHWEQFRDALVQFLYTRSSVAGWRAVSEGAGDPVRMFMLLALLYAGTIAYYYVTATRTREN